MEKSYNELFSSFEVSYEILFSLETIIKLTRDVCLEKELHSKYYNLASAEIKVLSEERNHYINMLKLALDKIYLLKELNTDIEVEISKLK